MSNNHPFHIVDQSPWPLINSINAMNLMTNLLIFLKTSQYMMLLLAYTLMTLLTILLWARDIFRESSFQGHHTFQVYKGMKISMILFILSEIMFFFSFFWAMFHFNLAPEMEISNTWPPKSINMINPYFIPLLNTSILLTSGVSITWCHFSIIMKKYKKSYLSLSLTIMMGLIFSLIQLMEYKWTDFSINDSVFGAIFFMATGFHGLHVIIGTTFLFINLIRLMLNQFNNIHHFSFEAAAWYWHFVDVVWIYLYIFMYWWFY